MSDDLDDGISELVFIDPNRVDGVSSPASGASFVLLKSVAAPSRAAAKAKAKPRAAGPGSAETAAGRARHVRATKAAEEMADAYASEARRLAKLRATDAKSKSKFGSRSPEQLAAFRANQQAITEGRKPAKSKAGKKRRRGAQPAVAVKAMSGSTEIPAMGRNEADAILRSVTGEGGQMCGGRTADGSPCMRPSVNGHPCHHHV